MDDQKRNIPDEMRTAATEIMARFENLGFMLVIFPFGAPGQCNYVSNARPQDVGPILKAAANSAETIKAKKSANIIPLNGN